MNALIAPPETPLWIVLPVPFEEPLTGTVDRVGPAANQQLTGLALTSVAFGEPETPGQGSATARIVRGLRDSVRRATRLTRQDIAGIIGVDRRSLSGWSNGSVEPVDENLNRLRSLARLVAELDRAVPGSSRWVFDKREPLEDIDVVRAVREGDVASVVRAMREHSTSVGVVTPQRTPSVRLPAAVADSDWQEFGELLDPAPAPVPILESSDSIGDDEVENQAALSRWAQHRIRRGATDPANSDA